MNARTSALIVGLALAASTALGQVTVTPDSLSSQQSHSWIAGGRILEPPEVNRTFSFNGSQTTAIEHRYTMYEGDDPRSGFPIFSTRTVNSAMSTTFKTFGDVAFQIREFVYVRHDLPAVSLYHDGYDQLRFTPSKTEDFGVIWSAASNTYLFEYGVAIFSPQSGLIPITDAGNGQGSTFVHLTAGIEYEFRTGFAQHGGYDGGPDRFMQGIATLYVIPAPGTLSIPLVLILGSMRRRH